MSDRRAWFVAQTLPGVGLCELDVDLGNLRRSDVASTHGRNLFGSRDVRGAPSTNVDGLCLKGTILLHQEHRPLQRCGNSYNPDVPAAVFDPFVSKADRSEERRVGKECRSR